MADHPAAGAVIVTGAASGIGRACVEKLLGLGRTVAAVDIAALPEAMLRANAKSPGEMLPLKGDVSVLEDCRRVVAETAARFGRIQGLIHCAAAHSVATWEELEPEEFDRILRVNVTGSFLIAKAAAEHMKANGGGAIVLTGSGSINSGGVGGHGRGGPAYVASKGAILALNRSLARSLGPHGIRVNTVAPGATSTAMTADYDETALKAVANRTILNRIGKPEEIAAVAAFLISDEARYMTGEMVNVNGGGSFGT